tara:strand:- start:1137 stop:1874 length:738 start_codon:yes stop_codon:yes gene_type:complete
MKETSRNNNDDDLLTGAFNVMFNYVNKKMQNSLPVKVTKVSADRKFVNVQPQILVVDSEGGTIIRGEIKGVPIVTSGSGNFLISFNVTVGDLGWIESSDRDISLFKQSYSQSKPNTKRMHSFSDARFIPDIMTDFSIDEEDSSALVIQNRDASVKITLSDSKIKLKAPALDIETTGLFKAVCAGGIDFNGVTIDAAGATFSPASFTAPNIIGSVDVTFNGISAKGHTHAYTWTDTAGSGTTDAPA